MVCWALSMKQCSVGLKASYATHNMIFIFFVKLNFMNVFVVRF